MCSFSWRDFGDHLGIAFNRDETILRAKAHPPRQFDTGSQQYIMPIDPDAGGSWICVNQAGLVFALLNNYQGRVKPKSNKLISRGEIIKALALCDSFEQAKDFMSQLELNKYQPFSVLLVSKDNKFMWEYDGTSVGLIGGALPAHYFSSAHPEANRVLSERLAVANKWHVAEDADLIALHRSHLPNNSEVEFEDRTFSICMHHTKGHTQSLTYIRLETNVASVKYWNGQPCKTQEYSETSLSLY